MQRFEYKLIEAPRRRRRYRGARKGHDAFAETVMDEMNALAMEGWEFVQTEELAETRRKLGVFSRTVTTDYFVYRRPLRQGGETLDDPVQPRRARRPEALPDRDALRSRVSAPDRDLPTGRMTLA